MAKKIPATSKWEGRSDSGGSKLADEAIERTKKELKPAPLPPPEKADE